MSRFQGTWPLLAWMGLVLAACESPTPASATTDSADDVAVASADAGATQSADAAAQADVQADSAADAILTLDVPATAQPDPAFDVPLDPKTNFLLQVPIADVNLAMDFMPTSSANAFPAETGFLAGGVQPGQEVPDFTLWTVAGKQASLSDWRGKSHVLLMVGSPSCFRFRDGALPQLAALAEFADAQTAKSGEKFEILLVMTKEAHPALDACPYVAQQWTGQLNVKDQILVRQPLTFGGRVLNDRTFVQRYGLQADHVFIDGMDDAAWNALGAMPNTLHLIDKNGVLRWKEVWAMQTGAGAQGKPTVFAEVGKLLGAAP